MSIVALNWAWQLRLKPTTKLVIMALADAADDEGYCWPSIPTLANKTCMDERSVQRILKELKSSNFIEVQARFRSDGSPTSNKYRLALVSNGDKLSLPSRQKSREVVTATTSPDGNHVTLTTIKPLINQKQPPQPSEETSKTSSGCLIYIFPNQLKQQECDLAKQQLDSIDPILAQSVLDELAARLNSNKVTGAPLSYLRSLISRAKTGQFVPEAGIRVATAREQANLAQRKKTDEAPKPTEPSEIAKHLAAMHQVLSRKSTPKRNQED